MLAKSLFTFLLLFVNFAEDEITSKLLVMDEARLRRIQTGNKARERIRGHTDIWLLFNSNQALVHCARSVYKGLSLQKYGGPEKEIKAHSVIAHRTF